MGAGSPFDQDFAPILATLPPALREQFLVAPDAAYVVVLTGRMDRVWRRQAWLRPLFALLARAHILFPETGVDVPACLAVSGHFGRHGEARQYWRRTFAFKPPRHFNATMTYDPRRRRVVERLGPGGLLQMDWELKLDEQGRLLIVAERAGLGLGRRCLPVPAWLGVMVRAVEEADPVRDDLIHIDLTVAHRLLGPIFGYSGAFQIERRPTSSLVSAT